METYVILINWTDQGIKAAKDTVNRSHQATQLVESMGAKIETMLWTSGAYDLVTIVRAPDYETLAAILLTLGAAGNLRTQTLRAFTEAEVTTILDKMP